MTPYRLLAACVAVPLIAALIAPATRSLTHDGVSIDIAPASASVAKPSLAKIAIPSPVNADLSRETIDRLDARSNDANLRDWSGVFVPLTDGADASAKFMLQAGHGWTPRARVRVERGRGHRVRPMVDRAPDPKQTNDAEIEIGKRSNTIPED